LYADQLQINAGRQSRMGKAEFRVRCMGSFRPGAGPGFNFVPPVSDSEWSLGFREAEPGAWKVTRISPTKLPLGLVVSPLIPPRPAPGPAGRRRALSRARVNPARAACRARPCGRGTRG